MADRAVRKLVTSIAFTQGSSSEVREGLIGYVSCIFAGALILDGITVRMTGDRRPALSFPMRTDKRGNQHRLVRPLDGRARRAIEAEVFEFLGIDPEGNCDVS